MRRRRVWSEEVPLAVARSPRVIELLAPRGIELCLAVRPGDEPELARTVGALADGGVRVALWPMLADRDGRWASARNAAAFAAWARRLVEDLARDGAPPAELAIDLEPPIDGVRAALDRPLAALDLVARDRALAPAAVARLRDLRAAIAAHGVALSCAVVPLVALGPAGAWEALLGTPVDGVAWDHVSAMLYSSILEGWSRGLVARADAVALVAAGARATARRFGAAAGVSVGAVGVGAFGDEPVLRSPAELREDVRAARAGGVDAITLLDLGGVLARPPAEAWLDALVEDRGPPPEAPSTARAAIAIGAASSLARVASLLGR